MPTFSCWLCRENVEHAQKFAPWNEISSEVIEQSWIDRTFSREGVPTSKVMAPTDRLFWPIHPSPPPNYMKMKTIWTEGRVSLAPLDPRISPTNNWPVVAGIENLSIFLTLQAKREKQSDELRRSGDKFIEFLDRADRWLSQNTKKIVELFRRFDQSGEGVVTHDEFKAGEH